jgi:hypothetical protein
MSHRLKIIKQKHEDNLMAMQSFCMNPTMYAYHRIEKDTKIGSEIGEAYDCWKLGVISTYGRLFKKLKDVNLSTYIDLNISDEDILKTEEEFERKVNHIFSRIDSKPTTGLVDSVITMYWATGDPKFLLKIYEAMGVPHSCKYVRDSICDTYIQNIDRFHKLTERVNRSINDKSIEIQELSPLFMIECTNDDNTSMVADCNVSTDHPVIVACKKFERFVAYIELKQKNNKDSDPFINSSTEVL